MPPSLIALIWRSGDPEPAAQGAHPAWRCLGWDGRDVPAAATPRGAVWPHTAWQLEGGILTAWADPLGAHPLYMARRGADRALSSSARWLIRWAGDLSWDEDAAARWLCDWEEGPAGALWPALEIIPPGAAVRLEATLRGVEAAISPPTPWPPAAPALPLFQALTRAVGDLAAGDPPPAVALSGGLDSLSLVAAARAAGIDPPVVRLVDAAADPQEAAHGDALVADLGLAEARHEVRGLPAALRDAVLAMEGPIINVRAVARYLLYGEVARDPRWGGRAPRILSGAGADELLLGQPSGWARSPGPWPGWARHVAEEAPLWEALLRRPPPPPSPRPPQTGGDPSERVARLRRQTAELVLASEVRAGAAWGVAVSLPFLASLPAAAALALPREALVSADGRVGKRALREATIGHLPEVARWQPKRPAWSPPGGGSSEERRAWITALTGPLQPGGPLDALVTPAALRDALSRYSAADAGDILLPPLERALMRLASLSILLDPR